MAIFYANGKLQHDDSECLSSHLAAMHMLESWFRILAAA